MTIQQCKQPDILPHPIIRVRGHALVEIRWCERHDHGQHVGERLAQLTGTQVRAPLP
mgnify:CR=1 FL=1